MGLLLDRDIVFLAPVEQNDPASFWISLLLVLSDVFVLDLNLAIISSSRSHRISPPPCDSRFEHVSADLPDFLWRSLLWVCWKCYNSLLC